MSAAEYLKHLERAADALETADRAIADAAIASGDGVTAGCLGALESTTTALLDALGGFIERARKAHEGGS